MALSFNLPKDSTNIIPLTLDMYRYPKAFYSADDERIGKKYRDSVEYYGEAEYIPPDISITNGKAFHVIFQRFFTLLLNIYSFI